MWPFWTWIKAKQKVSSSFNRWENFSCKHLFAFCQCSPFRISSQRLIRFKGDSLFRFTFSVCVYVRTFLAHSFCQCVEWNSFIAIADRNLSFYFCENSCAKALDICLIISDCIRNECVCLCWFVRMHPLNMWIYNGRSHFRKCAIKSRKYANRVHRAS